MGQRQSFQCANHHDHKTLEDAQQCNQHHDNQQKYAHRERMADKIIAAHENKAIDSSIASAALCGNVTDNKAITQTEDQWKTKKKPEY